VGEFEPANPRVNLTRKMTVGRLSINALSVIGGDYVSIQFRHGLNCELRGSSGFATFLYLALFVRDGAFAGAGND
jgi:hypothetical protein